MNLARPNRIFITKISTARFADVTTGQTPSPIDPAIIHVHLCPADSRVRLHIADLVEMGKGGLGHHVAFLSIPWDIHARTKQQSPLHRRPKTRLIESARTFPEAKTPGRLVSIRNRGQREVQFEDFASMVPVRTKLLSSPSISLGSQSVRARLR